MTAKERKRLKELEETVNSLARTVSGLVDHQNHLSPSQCPYCQPWHYFVPYHPWPRITSTWIGTPAPIQGFGPTVGNDQTVVSGEQTVTSGYIESNV